MEEIWKDIEGYEGFYKVSNKGRVKSLDRVVTEKNGKKRIHYGKILKLQTGKTGYMQVMLNTNHTPKLMYVHRLVGQAFIPNPSNKPQINHKDENKAHNNVENLEWVTSVENCNYGTRNKATRHPVRTALKTIDGGIVERGFQSIKQASEFLSLEANRISYASRHGNKTRGLYFDFQ